MRRAHVALGLAALALAALIAVGCLYRGYLAGVLPTAAAEVDDITLPPGFRIAVYAADVPNARQMAVGPAGIVFVGSRSAGKVYAVVDRDADHRADEVHVLASGLDLPSGVAFRDGHLYVADGTKEMEARLQRVLTNDPGLGVVRHFDAGYPQAKAFARRHKSLKIPMAR